MTLRQITTELTEFDPRSMYVNGQREDYFRLSSDGSYRCDPQHGNWSGRVEWTGIAPHYYKLAIAGQDDLPVRMMYDPKRLQLTTTRLLLRSSNLLALHDEFKELLNVQET